MPRNSEVDANQMLAASCVGHPCKQGRKRCQTPRDCVADGPSMFRQVIVSAAIVMAAAAEVLALIGGAS